MNRSRLLFLIVLGLVMLGILLVPMARTVPSAPRFVPILSQPAGPYIRMILDGGLLPAQDGKLWIWALGSTTNSYRCYLYDFDKRRVIGELMNASPVFFSRDQTKLLCQTSGAASSFKWKFIEWLRQSPGGRAWARRLNYTEEFCILDLKANSVKRIGDLSEAVGMGSSFIPAPGFRYAFNQPSTSEAASAFFLCDMEKKTLTRLTVRGELLKWWDDQNIIVHDSVNNFVLFDVFTRRTNALFSAEAIIRVVKQMGLPEHVHTEGRNFRYPLELSGLCSWNGIQYDFYLMGVYENSTGESFLLKADRETKTLKLIDRNFNSHFLSQGRLNTDGTHYLYEGQRSVPGQGGNGGVYLCDLKDHASRTLVEPDNGGQCSFARFCGKEVIYWRKGLLWRVDLSGSNNVPIFASPGQ